MSDRRVIHLVDDEEAIRRSAGFMLRTSGFTVETYESGDEFLKVVKTAEPGCVLLDIRMPGMDGLEVQQALADHGVTMPVVVLTGHGDVGTAVRAMKQGAVDFLEKPFEKKAVLAAIESAFARFDRTSHDDVAEHEAKVLVARLTRRETDVLAGLVRGHPNKTIAYDLGISPRTVEVHRANLMTKLEVRNLSEALRIAFAAGIEGEI
ncbi:response regulator [Stakelama sp. CBK3Z-3]|uniref:Response regulator n=1 Tax=Stakelama flava TaxID=2860338 RepID=A0ABS6XP64_9SPHN|nr:response regulator [Stakelama flava]MBW4331558.1 response regulator [Stakelama flava]